MSTFGRTESDPEPDESASRAAGRKQIDDSEPGSGSNPTKAERQVHELVEAIERHAPRAEPGLFHDDQQEGWARVEQDGRLETYRIRSRAFRRLLQHLFYRRNGVMPVDGVIETALDQFEGVALFDGPTREVFTRVGEDSSGAIYIDLGDRRWRCVRIAEGQWEVLERSPVPFARYPGMQPLPDPVAGGSLDDLRRFVNVATDEDWILVKCFLIASLRPRGPFFILVFVGEQGSAKSFGTRMTRGVTDPNQLPLRTLPGSERDLAIAARNSWVLAYDNLSGLTTSMSDSLCRLATGGGLGTRKLYTDDEETLLHFSRPLLLNGIIDFVTRPDLMDRALMLRIPKLKRRIAEQDLLKEYDRKQGEIFGDLLSHVARAHYLERTVEVEGVRMLDAARFAAASASAMGLEPNDVVRVIRANRDEVAATAVESDPVGETLVRWLDQRTVRSWTGSAQELLQSLSLVVDEATRASNIWPRHPRGLTGRIRQLIPPLREVGIEIEFLPREAQVRPIKIGRVSPAEPSQPSNRHKRHASGALGDDDVGQDRHADRHGESCDEHGANDGDDDCDGRYSDSAQ